MPEPVRYFLAQLVRHQSQLEAERLHRARSDWVDYEHPDMERALRAFFGAVEAHMRVPQDEWADTLHQATHHVTAYLVEPTHVLGEFVFDDRNGPLHIDQVMWRMKFFGPYGYLRDAVRAYVDQRDDDRLTRSVFETFLHRIDQRVTAEYNADRWIRLLGPLFRIARTATGSAAVPVSALARFFDEKGADALVDRLRATDLPPALGPDRLRRLLDPVTPASGRAEASPLDAVSGSERAAAPDPVPLSPDPEPNAEPDAEPNAEPDARPGTENASSLQGGSSPPGGSSPASSPPSSPAERGGREDGRQAIPSSPNPQQAAASGRQQQHAGGSPDLRQQEKSGGTDETPSATAPPRQESPRKETSRAEPSYRENDAGEGAGTDGAAPGRGEDASRQPEDEAGGADAPASTSETRSSAPGSSPPSDSSTDVWGVDGAARPHGAADDPNDPSSAADENGSVPLWKQFQGERSRSTRRGDAENRPETPLWARFQSDDASEPDSAPAPSGRGGAASSRPGGESTAGADGSEGAASRSTRPAAAPADQIEGLEQLEQSVLGERRPPQRSMYVRQLFNGSAAEYQRVLRRLEGCDDWSRASQIIAQDIFRKHKVNIYSDAAVRFTNAVESRFRS